jgi:hypothetical protein
MQPTAGDRDVVRAAVAVGGGIVPASDVEGTIAV